MTQIATAELESDTVVRPEAEGQAGGFRRPATGGEDSANPRGDSRNKGSERPALSAAAEITSAAPEVALGERYRIRMGNPLPHLDSPLARAYAVEDSEAPGDHLFALVCEAKLPIRISILDALRKLDSSGRIAIVEWDAIGWPGGARGGSRWPVENRAVAGLFRRHWRRRRRWSRGISSRRWCGPSSPPS